MAKTKRASASGILALINRIEAVAGTLETLCKCVYGNGVPGLKGDVIAIKAQIKIILLGLGACIAGIIIPIGYALISKLMGGG
jgi:hypothetical protein